MVEGRLDKVFSKRASFQIITFNLSNFFLFNESRMSRVVVKKHPVPWFESTHSYFDSLPPEPTFYAINKRVSLSNERQQML